MVKYYKGDVVKIGDIKVLKEWGVPTKIEKFANKISYIRDLGATDDCVLDIDGRNFIWNSQLFKGKLEKVYTSSFLRNESIPTKKYYCIFLNGIKFKNFVFEKEDIWKVKNGDFPNLTDRKFIIIIENILRGLNSND